MLRKRILPVLLCVCLLSGLWCVPAVADGMTVSETVLDLTVGWEGFLPYYSGGYIGYGTAVSASDYPNGISEETARALMQQTYAEYGALIERFFAARGVTLTQQQFDALCCMAYNTGPGWLSESYRICRTIIAGGYTANELASAMGIWCHVGTTVNEHLAMRRAAEAAMFLYGDYSGGGERFRWVIYNPDGGSVEHDVAFFETGLPYGALLEPEKDGWAFAGWYTEDGEKLTADAIVSESLTVTARWVEPGTALPEAPQLPAGDATPGTGETDPGAPGGDTDASTPDEPAAGDPSAGDPPAPEAPSAGGPTRSFPDLTPDLWYYADAMTLVAGGVVNGYPDGAFHGAEPVSRAQALKLVLLAAGWPEMAPTGADWASGYRDLAVALGFLSVGQWDDLSMPATRLEIARLACAALGLTDPGIVSPFADLDDPAASALYQTGIFTGRYDAQGVRIFDPAAEISRGEVCAVIRRILDFRQDSYAPEGY